MSTSRTLVMFILFLSSLSSDAQLSIDCGASISESYKDENSMEWVGDDGYIQNGDSKVVEFSSLLPSPMSTLRAFSAPNKNCYTVKVDQGERVLVRANFYYGNYDGNSSPPVFDLLFDGNYWTTVNTTSFDVISHEAIYVVRGNSTSVCVAQTKPDQLPFISALEIRSLGSNMYRHVGPNYAMFVRGRAAFGANETIRYVDAYDRIWDPATGFGLTTVSNDAVSIKVTVDNDPPPAILRNAATVPSTSNYIILITDLPDKPIPIYLAIYFSEVTRLTSTSLRSFRVHVDNKPYSDPIIPPFGGVSQVDITNMIASSRTSFTVEATSDSTLPPLVNAFELYSISEPLTNGTSGQDVEGLAVLKRGFEVLERWSGDPCLPSPYSWEWIKCSSESDAQPRVTALYLSGFELSGSLPDFSSMDALETIDLHNNSLVGPIPGFLAQFPNLKLLNLADNRFNGSIPTSLSKNKKLKLVVTGNCFTGDECKKIDIAPSTETGTEPKATGLSPGIESETPPPPTTTGGSTRYTFLSAGVSNALDNNKLLLQFLVYASFFMYLLSS